MAGNHGTKAVGAAALLATSGIAVNQALLLLGGRKNRREATEHPFGYGRERYGYALIVSLVVFSVGHGPVGRAADTTSPVG